MAVLRTLVGAAFLGAVTDTMLLGHWYLVQPGLPAVAAHRAGRTRSLSIWPLEVLAMLLPTGMVSVWTGAVDDGWGGVLGWFWGRVRDRHTRPRTGDEGHPSRRAATRP